MDSSSRPRGEFFCGDGRVQTASSCDGNQSSNCVKVTGNGSNQYPGPGWTGNPSPFTSEKCDPEDTSTKNSREKLCNIAFGNESAPEGGYYAKSGSTMPSCSACQSITNATADTGCNYCGDGTLGGPENCEIVSNGLKYGNGTNEIIAYSNGSLSYEYSSSTSWTIPVSGLYTIQIEGGKGGTGGRGREGEYSDQQNGSAGSNGSVVASQYYLKAGTTVSFTRGENGSTGNTAGSGRGGVSPGGSGGYLNGGIGGNGSNGEEHSICGDAGGGGSGGGGGGAAYLKIGSDLIITANGGQGGQGGKGGGGKGGLFCAGGNQGDGGSGGSGGAGGTYDGSHSNWSNTSSGTGWKYIGTASTGSASGSSRIKISLSKYAPCNLCTFSTSTDTSGFLYPNQRKVDCTGLIDNAQWNTAASITQTYSGGSWSPNTTTGAHNTTASTAECRYKCVNNYVYEGSKCINTKTASCSGLPSNAVWSSNSSTSKTITQNYEGADGSGSWKPSTTGTYNTSTATGQCYYKCKSGYHNEGGVCVSSADKVYTCTGLPANAQWNSVGAYTQSWNGSAWTPAASSATYNTTPSTTSCVYKCKSGYTWEGGSCINKKTVNCGTVPAGGIANTSTTMVQTWNASTSKWEPAVAWEHDDEPSTTACHYKCKNGYYWLNNQCMRTSWSFENSDDMLSNPIYVSYGDYSWSTNDEGGVGAYSGSKAMCSGNRTKSSTTSTMNLTINMPEAGNISFYVKGESESTSYDYLTITLDDVQKEKTASLTSWTKYSYDLSAGTHILSFAYRKDGSVDTSYDSYCIDDVKLKLSSVVPPIAGTWDFEDEYTNYGFITGISNSNSNYPWQQMYSSDIGTHSGSKAMCSTNYNVHSTDTSMTMNVKVPISGTTLSFYLKGTSENSSSSDWDTFYFSIDGTEKLNSKTGTTLDGVNKTGWQSWTNPSYSLSAGTHTLTFRYKKDGSTHQPTDRYCIDDLTLTLPSCSSLSLKSAPLYLKFNEGSGSTTANSGTSGGSYSISGGSWNANGRRSKAYTFSGSTTVSTNVPKYADNFTMMAWVKVTNGYTISLPSQSSSGTNGTSGQHYLFGANHEGGNSGAGLSVGTNGIFVTAHGDGYMPPLAVYSGSLETDWHHVAVVFRSRTPYIYLDGVLVKTGSASQRTTYSPTNVGSGSYGSFYGTLDDVRIIGSALSDQEVMEEYGKLAACTNF